MISALDGSDNGVFISSVSSNDIVDVSTPEGVATAAAPAAPAAATGDSAELIGAVGAVSVVVVRQMTRINGIINIFTCF